MAVHNSPVTTRSKLKETLEELKRAKEDEESAVARHEDPPINIFSPYPQHDRNTMDPPYPQHDRKPMAPPTAPPPAPPVAPPAFNRVTVLQGEEL